MWLVIAIAFALASCNEEEEAELHFFFDSEEFAETEIGRLQLRTSEVSKTIVLNGESETLEHIEADSTVYQEMRNLFKQANINDAKFVVEYEIDTFWMMDPITMENIEVLNYTTSNPELKLKWMQVYSNGSLKACLAMKNFLFSYEKEIFYKNGESFSVLSWQKTLSQDSLHLFSQLDFL